MSDASDSGTPEPSEPGAETETGTAEATETATLRAELDKWKQLARQNENAYKKTAKELDGIRKEAMSDQERAIAEATERARKEALSEFGIRLVDAEVRAAAVGRDLDADALLAGLDRARFVGDDGEPDRKAIAGFLDALAPKGRQDLGQGRRGGNSAPDMNSLLRAAAGRTR